jgi:hypothetical protein
MFIQDRLIRAASRSLAVMIGFARGAKGRGRDRLRGSPRRAFAPTPPVSFLPGSTPATPR